MLRDDLITFLHEYLKVAAIKDHCPNGLQVEGKSEIQRITTGVSISLELIQRAVAKHSDMILVHHGLIWNNQDPVVKGLWKERLKLLLVNDINLIVFHLPLDAHPEVGNNFVAARDLGLLDLAPFGSDKINPIGVQGRFENPLTIAAFQSRLAGYFRHAPLAFTFGQDTIGTVAMVSGGGAYEFAQAIRVGSDAFVTGEPSEWALHMAKEAQMNFFAVGHYDSEKAGIQALGRLIIERFGIPVEFADLPNPV